MSTLTHSSAEGIFFTTETNLRFWEGLGIREDVGTETLSIVGQEPAPTKLFVSEIFLSVFSGWSWRRILLSGGGLPKGAMRRKLAIREMSQVLPGFVDSRVCVSDESTVVVSTLEDLVAAEWGALDSHNRVVLFGVRDGGMEIECDSVLSLGSLMDEGAIEELLQTYRPSFLWRFLDQETHVVAQGIGSPTLVSRVAHELVVRDVAEVSGDDEIASKIGGWRT